MYICTYHFNEKCMHICICSSTSTGGSHVSAAKTNGNTDSNGHSDKVLYAAPAKTATIPHHTAAGGQEYAVSTKATNKTSQAQPPSEHYDDVQGTKKDAQGVRDSYVCM